MKSSILRMFVTLGLGATLGSVALRAQELRANIPFDFTLGKQSFAAGDYQVRQLSSSVLQIRNLSDHSGAMTVTHPSPAEQRGKTLLTFHRYGDNYFLTQVSDGDRDWLLPQSTIEKGLIAKRTFSRPVTVASALSAKK